MEGAGLPTGRFRPSDRLLDSRDYRRVMRQGRRLSSRDFVVIVADRPDFLDLSEKRRETKSLEAESRTRLGITASRKVGNAVCRNRFKRRVRAWFREHRGELVQDVDLVVIARKSSGQLNGAEIDQRLSRLLGLRRSTG